MQNMCTKNRPETRPFLFLEDQKTTQPFRYNLWNTKACWNDFEISATNQASQQLALSLFSWSIIKQMPIILVLLVTTHIEFLSHFDHELRWKRSKMKRARKASNPSKWCKFGIHLIVFILCLGYVILQCYQCIEKYVANPQGTFLTVDYGGNQPFPGMTICPHDYNLAKQKDDQYKYFSSTLSVLEACELRYLNRMKFLLL